MDDIIAQQRPIWNKVSNFYDRKLLFLALYEQINRFIFCSTKHLTYEAVSMLLFSRQKLRGQSEKL